MKRLLTVVAILAAFTNVSFSQTEKGKIFVAGSSNLSFTSQKAKWKNDGETIGDDESITQFNIKPSVGYFIANNFAIALSFSYERKKEEDNMDRTFLVGPMVRYYFMQSNIKPYVQGDLMFGSYKNEVEESMDFKGSVFGWDLGGGVAFFMNDYVSIDLGLGYTSASIKPDVEDDMYSSVFGGDSKRVTRGIAFEGGLTIAF